MDNCETGCAYNCGTYLNTDSSFGYRSLVMGNVGTTLAVCDANIINITWSDASAEDIEATNAGTCEYSGDIRTPRAATNKPGKRFRGWKFIKPSAN